MFENRVKPVFNKNRAATKKYGDISILVARQLTLDEMYYVVETAVNQFRSVLETSGNKFTAIMSAMAQMDVSIVGVATNIEIGDYEYDDYNDSGFLAYLRKTVTNYDIVKTLTMTSVEMEYGERTIEPVATLMGSMATTDELAASMANTTQEIEEFAKIFNSDNKKALDYAKVVFANNPRLAKVFGGDTDGK